MKTIITTCSTLLFILFCLPFATSAQTVYDNDFQDINFGGTNVQMSNYPPTSNGTAVGDKVLYQNVTILDGDTIDCYVELTSVTSGTNMSNFDKAATSGSTGSIIEDEFFAPQMSFPAGTSEGPGGEVKFVFHFIEHNSFSYNSGTNTASGTPVALLNVRLNAYDIDGNASAYSNEYLEFNNFVSSELDGNTNVVAVYNHATQFTSFGSPTHLKTQDATEDKNRVRVNYDTASTIEFHILGGSTYYVFIDFGPGLSYTNDPITHYRLSGMIYDDGDGLVDNVLDGTPIQLLDGNNLYVNLVNSGDSVVRSEPVQAGGYYSFAAVPAGTYSIQTSTEQTSINSVEVDPSLPSLWVNTGENLGLGTGHDGTVDGILTNVVMSTEIVTNAFLAVNKRPESYNVTHGITSPVWGLFMYLGASGTDPLNGTDLEDGSLGAGDYMAITALPNNGNELYYNGSKIQYGDDGVNPPSSSNPFYMPTYTVNLLQVRFVGLLTSSVSFEYATIDEAGFMDETPATYTLNWSLPVPVKLIEFNAEKVGFTHQLKWVTASEHNTEKFVIERMINGSEDIIVVGEVSANGFSQQLLEYSFSIDFNQDAQVAYRIKMVDFDGYTEYSNWETVEAINSKGITVFPNPASGSSLTVNVGRANSSTQVELMDMTGKVIKNISATADMVEVDLSDVQAGMYTVRVVQNGIAQTQRVYVLK
ncbi:T9SS type A sorting domain-containing protein [bacterium]|nr:T9SS type A sorting domain-containing protein [bacterium]